MAARVALVTGANRGLGYETSRQLAQMGHQVLMTARDADKGEKAASELRGLGEVRFHPLDVTDMESIAAIQAFVSREYGRLDVLVNNAGIAIDGGKGLLNVPAETLRTTLETNSLGPLLLARAFIAMMRAQNYGRIVNVSSSMGQMHGLNNSAPSYRLSKLALNGLTRILADAVRGKNILVNAVCPGWVRTDMGGPGASRSLEQGARGIIWAATLPDDGPSGGFFRDGKEIDW